MATREKRVEASEIRREELEFAEEERRAEEERAMAAADEARSSAATTAAAEAAGWETEEEELDMGASDRALSMKASVTEEASDDVRKLWSGIEGTAPEQTEEEKEAMRLDNLKRKYQNAIGRLPYGIPSKELAGMDWMELSALLATGEKKTVEGGAEVTQVNGRWYYSDADDTGTFLTEHGKKVEPKREPPKAAAAS
ncbi:MAG: hypothetical protein GWN18_20135, partial [Thermoplasmata archaeon]|nr:hypothetical protein [Thermoplasmata archaeon]NIS14435.1 hypothetical protein [Thermoplasmata archaeon]NIS22285.1 hypothetical protein [Thermoplasmata archaeon]NIT77692.1 hypothetical protein [Thermoplasmata archaeon]NIU51290.1 hypothetical protein [Thermoplasmata archaeon]